MANQRKSFGYPETSNPDPTPCRNCGCRHLYRVGNALICRNCGETVRIVTSDKRSKK